MPRVRTFLTLSSLFSIAAMGTVRIQAQSNESARQRSAQLLAVENLPDSPSASLSVDGDSTMVSSSSTAVFNGEQQSPVGGGLPKAGAPGTAVYPRQLATKIPPGVVMQPLSVRDKFEMSVARQLTLGTFAGTVVSSGINHLADNRPHYGTDRAGFGERLGASALRSTSQSIFNYGLYSSIFHDDPRYYVLGPQFSVKKRAIYAATRVILTRKDDGSRAINYPFLAAVASSAALTNAYYPERDRSVGVTIGGVFTTIALNAGIMQLNEFGGDIRHRIFHRHEPRP